MEKADVHDGFLSAKCFVSYNPEYTGDSSLFVKEITGASSFNENKLYCGTRAGQVIDAEYDSFDESLYIYVTKVENDCIFYFIVAYELQYFKDGKKQVYTEKFKPPYPPRMEIIDKDSNTLSLHMHMFDDPDVDYVDDTEIIVSPKVSASLKGWWQN